MSRRVKSEDRRAEIVSACLELLADTPLERLTTRQIARRLGISQPALFRHFRSRDQILLALMERARADLGAMAEEVLRRERGPVEQLAALARGLLAHVARNPGLPRLLFSPPADGPLRAALRRLVSTQASLVAELVREGQRRGELRASLEPERAAALFVGLVQGLVLRHQLFEDEQPLEAHAGALLELWLDGARARGEEGGEEPPGPRAAGTRPLLALDVRPILEAGRDPLSEIVSALEALRPGGVLALAVPFRPAPLITLLRGRGHGVEERALEGGLHALEIVRGGGEVEDLLDLPPPEPLERALEASAALEPGALYRARVPRVPRLLLPRLEERGLGFATHELPDGSALLVVWRER